MTLKSVFLFLVSVSLCYAASAQVTWRRTYGGFGIDQGRGIRQSLDGGYAVLGSTGSFGFGASDMYLIKLDANGDRQWSKTYGTSDIEQGWNIASLSDGYALVGFTSSGGGYNGLLVRTDLNGSMLWQRVYGTPQWDFLYAVDTLSDGFFIAGQTYSNSNGAEAWLLRTDLNGDTLWTRSFGTPYEDVANDVKSTSDGGCIVAATFGNSDGTSDAALVKFNAGGEEEWHTTIGGAGNDTGEGVALTSDGNYALGGTTESFSAFSEMLFAKVDSNGGSMWLQHIGQAANWRGHKIRARADGGLLLVGYTEAFGNGGKDVYLLFTDADGYFQQGRTYGGTEDDEGWSMDLTSDGGIVVAGDNRSAGPGVEAVYVVKGDTIGMTSDPQDYPDFDPLSVNEITQDEEATIWPNLLSPGEDLHIRLMSSAADARARITDLQGSVVADLAVPQREMTLHLPTLAPGLYLLSVIEGDKVYRPMRFVIGD